MSGNRLIHNLALVGFMGSGKSSIGHVVAEALHFEFVDTDSLIESNTGMPIAEIFARHGEPAFRDLEAQVVKDLARRHGAVIATGGGLPVNSANMESLKTHALVVCLWASPETIYERVRNHSHRPLLNDPDPLGKIRQLLAVRETHYRQADVLLSTDARTVREIASQVVHHFRIAKSPQV